LLSYVGYGGWLLMRVLLRVVILGANSVCYRVESRRWNALALNLMVQLEGLWSLLVMIVRRHNFRFMQYHAFLVVLMLFLLDQSGEVVMTFP
jgi:hypothetical protein